MKKHVRYLVAVDQVLKNTSGFSVSGAVVIRIPYRKTPSCPCPSLPKLKFFFVGQVVIQQTEGDPALELTVTQPARVQKWNKDLYAKFNSKCTKHFDFKE